MPGGGTETLEKPRDGVEAALFVTLVLLEEKGLAQRFQAILEAAAGRCSVEAASSPGAKEGLSRIWLVR